MRLRKAPVFPPEPLEAQKAQDGGEPPPAVPKREFQFPLDFQFFPACGQTVPKLSEIGRLDAFSAGHLGQRRQKFRFRPRVIQFQIVAVNLKSAPGFTKFLPLMDHRRREHVVALRQIFGDLPLHQTVLGGERDHFLRPVRPFQRGGPAFLRRVLAGRLRGHAV